MGTKIFSSRVDEKKLAMADAIAKRDAGISFGQFCGTRVLDYVCLTGELPMLEADEPTTDAFRTMRLLSKIHA